MISILLGVLMLLAALSWVIAVISAIQIVGLAPKGEKLRTYGQLGWWQFDKIRTTVGAAADLHIRRYQRAFAAFFFIVIVAAVGGVLLGAQAQN